jgi:inosine-uridine nucleoside N-ribohydrolase
LHQRQSYDGLRAVQQLPRLVEVELILETGGALGHGHLCKIGPLTTIACAKAHRFAIVFAIVHVVIVGSGCNADADLSYADGRKLTRTD